MNTPRRCATCGSFDVTVRKGTHHFRESGLDNVHLANVDIITCNKCGERTVPIPKAFELMKCVGEAIVSEPGLLSGPEIRFLRKNLGMKITEFARELGVERGTVSDWENGRNKPAKPNERLIRLLYATRKKIGERFMERLLGYLSKEEMSRDFDYCIPIPPESQSCELPTCIAEVAKGYRGNRVSPR